MCGIGRNVLDERDIKPGGLKRPQSGFTAGTGALDVDFDILNPVLLGLFSSHLGGNLRGKRSDFFETP